MRNFVLTFFSNLTMDDSMLFVRKFALMQNFRPKLRREYDPRGSPACVLARLKIALLCGWTK